MVAYLLLRWLFADRFWWLALAHTFALYLFLPLILTLPVALVLRWRGLIAVQVALSLVAAAWFLPPTLPKAIAPTDAPTLKIVTYNVLHGNPTIPAAVDWLLTTDADVIVLQEIVAEGYDPDLRPILEVYPHEAIIPGSVRVYSRLPLLDQDIIAVESFPPGRLVNRVTVEVAGQPVTLYGVHFSLPRGERPHLPLPLYEFPFSLILNYDETRRNTQIERLLERIALEDNPVIVAGDFNTSAYSPMHDRIAAHLTDSFLEAGSGFGTTWPSNQIEALPGFIPPLIRIDYVWHSAALRAIRAETGPANGSDHLPLVVTLVLD